jgi:hypothetical protein
VPNFSLAKVEAVIYISHQCRAGRRISRIEIIVGLRHPASQACGTCLMKMSSVPGLRYNINHA